METISKREFNVTGPLRGGIVGGINEWDWSVFQTAVTLALSMVDASDKRRYYYEIGADSLQLTYEIEGGSERSVLPFSTNKSVCNFVEQWIGENVPHTDAAGECFGYRIHLSGAPDEICTVGLISIYRGK